MKFVGAIQYIYYIQTKPKTRELNLSEGRYTQYVNSKDLFDRKFAFNIKEIIKSHLEKNTSQHG